MKILYVEDNKRISDLAKAIFMNTRNEFLVCDNIKDAKMLVETINFDLIILDLIFPDESGLDLLRHIEKNKIDSTVIVYSGFIDDNSLSYLKYYQDIGILKNYFEKGRVLFSDIIDQIQKFNTTN